MVVHAISYGIQLFDLPELTLYKSKTNVRRRKFPGIFFRDAQPPSKYGYSLGALLSDPLHPDFAGDQFAGAFYIISPEWIAVRVQYIGYWISV